MSKHISWTKQKIKIAITDSDGITHNRPLRKSSSIEVKAEVLGYFALHRTDGLGFSYTLTHIPTGRRSGWHDSKAKLRRLAIEYHKLGKKFATKSVKIATQLAAPIHAKWKSLS